MTPSQTLRLAGFVLLLTTLTGCATRPGPDLMGPQGPDIMAAYSGDWVLLSSESDNMAEKMLEAMAAPRGGAPGGRPAGRTAGGRSSRGTAAGMDSQQMQQALATVRVLAEVPMAMKLILAPQEATLVPARAQAMTLALGAREQRIQQGRATFLATARWTEKGLVIQRAGETAGRVKDEIAVDDQGRLVMIREISLPGRGTVRGTLRYARQTPEG